MTNTQQRVPSAELRAAMRAVAGERDYILTKEYERAGVCWVLLDERTGERVARFEWAPNTYAAEAYANAIDERYGRPGLPLR